MRRFPAEWEEQQLVLLSFPHQYTDWAKDGLQKSLTPFIRIAQAIAYSQPVYILCSDSSEICRHFCSTKNITFIEIPTNDTWIRDYGYIGIYKDSSVKLLDFTFDGWGGKFEATLDNNVNQALHDKGYMGSMTIESADFVLEGGSVESDGEGTILTTTSCLCNPNRNSGLGKQEIENRLEQYLGAKRVLWLDDGYLAGDDTDSHVDTLARFVDSETIVYVKCDDEKDEHYASLQKMEEQLKKFTTKAGDPYKLVSLPMCEAKFNKRGERLPATYANFLITNKAILYPIYSDKSDKKTGEILANLFPKREIIPINCLRLIEQGGSLHCSTMQIPKERE